MAKVCLSGNSYRLSWYHLSSNLCLIILVLLAFNNPILATESAIESATESAAELETAKTTNESISSNALEIKKHAEYSKKGADTCLKCHDSDSKFPVLDIFKTPHGSKSNKASPFGQKPISQLPAPSSQPPASQAQCESCHGPAGEHSKGRLKSGEKREPMISFETGNGIPVLEKNKICESCHQKVDNSHWQGSDHQMSDVACSDCHKIHAEHDPIQNKSLQIQVCGNCHQSQKLAANRFSSHPLKYGQQMGCVGCHSPHGSVSEHLLVAETTNDTCYLCHAEKRGPFLWEHEPASEDCTLCHAPHGSNQKAMLVQKPPFLCQNCHSSEGHPSLARDNASIEASSAIILGRSCSNCHSQVHGSNHPSASRLQR